MGDTTVKKVQAATAPRGEMGQIYLVSGKSVSMRLWDGTQTANDKPGRKRDYETVGFVIEGSAQLNIEGQTLKLEPGDSWLVPAGAEHSYDVEGRFLAVEATSPPAQVHGRDAKVR